MEDFFKGFANTYKAAFSHMYMVAKTAIDAWPTKDWYAYGSLAACLVFILVLLLL